MIYAKLHLDKGLEFIKSTQNQEFKSGLMNKIASNVLDTHEIRLHKMFYT